MGSIDGILLDAIDGGSVGPLLGMEERGKDGLRVGTLDGIVLGTVLGLSLMFLDGALLGVVLYCNDGWYDG